MRLATWRTPASLTGRGATLGKPALGERRCSVLSLLHALQQLLQLALLVQLVQDVAADGARGGCESSSAQLATSVRGTAVVQLLHATR